MAQNQDDKLCILAALTALKMSNHPMSEAGLRRFLSEDLSGMTKLFAFVLKGMGILVMRVPLLQQVLTFPVDVDTDEGKCIAIFRFAVDRVNGKLPEESDNENFAKTFDLINSGKVIAAGFDASVRRALVNPEIIKTLKSLEFDPITGEVSLPKPPNT